MEWQHGRVSGAMWSYDRVVRLLSRFVMLGTGTALYQAGINRNVMHLLFYQYLEMLVTRPT